MINEVIEERTRKKQPSPSTVGRGKSKDDSIPLEFKKWTNSLVSLYHGNSLDYYREWESPQVIVSDGAYGILGFDGDTSDHMGLTDWYEPHISNWSKRAKCNTTLWFWNTEIGWATIHPILEKYGWRYVNANIWNKGKGHIAGNVNTSKIRRFPVVTEVCAHYVFEEKINGMTIKQWLYSEWKRAGLTLKQANLACGVKDAASRKYFDQGHLWYFPPADKFALLANFANIHGKKEGRPYYSLDDHTVLTSQDWQRMRATFNCPYGITNVWERAPLKGEERITNSKGKVVHLNQKPLDLMEMIIKSSSDENDIIWEPFGGLFSASLAAYRLNRRARAAEIDSGYYKHAINRFIQQYL